LGTNNYAQNTGFAKNIAKLFIKGVLPDVGSEIIQHSAKSRKYIKIENRFARASRLLQGFL
jgi:hypothetical protein